MVTGLAFKIETNFISQLGWLSVFLKIETLFRALREIVVRPLLFYLTFK